jgi:hypothetical protein
MRATRAEEVYDRYVKSLPQEEIARLVSVLVARLDESESVDQSTLDLLNAVVHGRSTARRGPATRGGRGKKHVKPRDIMDLGGLGKEIWQGVDVERYIDDIRTEWNRE